MVMKYSQRGIVCALLLFSFARANEPVAETEEPTLDDYYQVGQALFDAFAPPEIKEQFEFPTPQQWMAFASRLQNTLQGDSLEDLIVYEPEARATLIALRAMPGYEDYAEWLEERLDYIDAAKQVAPAPPRLPSVQPKKRLAEEIPHLQLWRDRMQTRAVPSRVAKLVPKLRTIFADEGMPPDLVWLAEAESSFNPKARSPVGARGLFQFMPATAKEMGLRTFLPDERENPEKSARAAAQYLRQLYHRFESWPLALAAYNAGGGRVNRTLNNNRATTFAEISDALPAETRMYVPKVLATMERRAGINWAKLPPPQK